MVTGIDARHLSVVYAYFDNFSEPAEGGRKFSDEVMEDWAVV